MPQVLCPIVVGRDPELVLVEDRLSAAHEGSGGVVFLVGEAGIGKSRLTREAEARARHLGMRVLRGRAVQAAAPIAFRPLAEAIHEGLRSEAAPTAPELRPYHAALARLVPEWSEVVRDPPPEAAPLLVLEAALRLLQSLAASAGLLIVLEDLHWADADTLAAVEYLSDHLGRSPCCASARCGRTSQGPGYGLRRRCLPGAPLPA